MPEAMPRTLYVYRLYAAITFRPSPRVVTRQRSFRDRVVPRNVLCENTQCSPVEFSWRAVVYTN